MPETLTESFCERCGSRYTFESAAPKQRMRGMRVLSRGVKNFVLDDKTSFDEAMAAARMDTDRVSTNAQLDAFHKTFNFCMECRQYTCPDCWNDAEGRCLGCAPLLAEAGPATASPFHTAGASPFHAATAAPTNGAANGNGTAGANGTGAAYGVAASNGHALVEPEAEFDPLARLAFLTAAAPAADPEPVVAEPEPVAVELEPDTAAEPEPVVEAAVAETVAEVEVEVEVEPAVEAELVVDSIEPAVAVEAEPDPDAVAAAAIAAALIEPEWISSPLPAEALVAEPEPVLEAVVEAEPDVAEAAAEPEPVLEVVAEPEPDVVAEPIVEAAPEPEPVLEAVAEPEASVATPAPRIEIEPETMARPVVVTDPSDPTTEIAAVAAARTSVMFTSMRPGQSIDDAIAEYDQAAPEPEPVVAAEPEPVIAAEPEPVIAAAEPEPVVVPPAPVVVEPVVPDAPAIAATAAPVDVVAQPTWSVIAPDPDQAGTATPEWPTQQPTPGLPFLGRPAVPTGGVDALWAASSQQVGAPSPTDRAPSGGVQDCVSCGLSLSATARFCRRCGSAQHR